MPKKQTKYILYVGYAAPQIALDKLIKWIKKYRRDVGTKVELVFIHESSRKLSPDEMSRLHFFSKVLSVDSANANDLTQKLGEISENLLAVLCRAEGAIPLLAKLIPYVPYSKLPTAESLLWSVNKLEMRRRFKAYNPKITPKFRHVKNFSEEEVMAIEKKLSYPLIVKPYGLAQSLLVTNVYHRDELQKALKNGFKSLARIYRQEEKQGIQGFLVEELLEGPQYSVDCYVNSKGKIYYCPLVHVKTGKQIGFDDYFGYRQMTPTKLKKETIEDAQEVARDAIHALGLRSTTTHVELLRTEHGWKVIEVGPRVGGFRENLYELSYGFDHAINDLLIRMGKPPVISRTIKGYTAAMKMYAKKEGKIVSVKGIKKLQQLESFVELMSTPKKKGADAIFAKNGGKSIVNVLLHNEDRSRLLADIRRLEQMFDVEVG